MPTEIREAAPRLHFKHLPSTLNDLKNNLSDPSESLLQNSTKHLKLERKKKKALEMSKKFEGILTLSSVPSPFLSYLNKTVKQLVPVRNSTGNLNTSAASKSSLKHDLTLNNLHLDFQQQLHFKELLENS